MNQYEGKFELLAPSGSVTEQGACRVGFDDEKLTLVPETGTTLVVDLGDLDTLSAADYELRARLYSGETVRLRQFGRSYEELAKTLLECYRGRTLQCLLLEDLAEVDRFEAGFALNVPGGEALSGPAQVRLFKSNLAVLPNASQAFQWRLADIERLEFDAHSYEIVLERDGQQLRLNRVGKYTERAQTRLRQAYDGLRAEAAQALHTMLPFLNATQLRAVAERMPEGHSAPVGELAIIDPRIPQTLTANAVDKTLRPYYDELLRRSRSDLLYAGFKVIRSDDESLRRALEEDVASRADLGGDAAQGDLRVDGRNAVHEEGAVPLVLQWFFFPLVVQGGSALRNVVAWEACTGGGRATYFLRLLDAAEAPALQDVGGAPSAVKRGVDRITRVLGLLNFRRRPIYLPDDELQGNASFHRYAIASRRIAELRWVRGAFLGRALHSSFDAWRAQVEAILQSARD